MKNFISLILTLLFSFFSAATQICDDKSGNFVSPVCTDAKYILIAGSALSFSLYMTRNIFERELQDRVVQKNHLNNTGEFGGDIGFGYLNASYALGAFTFGGAEGKKSAEQMIEASAYTFSWTMALKKSVNEPRPGRRDDPDSFPSGHSSFSFAFASVVTANHGWYWGGVAYGMATFISFSRMDQDWHYLHDVVAGATIGLSYGWGVYFNQEQRKRPYWLSLIPTENGPMAIYAMKW